MKITVIGYWGGYPEVNEATSSYLLQHDSFNLVVDCGSGALSRLQNYIDIKDIDAVLLSHYHYDHIADIGPLQYARQIKTKLNEVNKELLIYGHEYDVQSFSKLTMKPFTQGVPYNPAEQLRVGPFGITFCETKHPVKCFAMRISDGSSTFVYTADTSFFKELVTFSEDADLIACECNFYKGQEASAAGHMNSIDTSILAKEANVKRLLLTHLPHFGNTADLLKDAHEIFSGEIFLASSGWNIEI